MPSSEDQQQAMEESVHALAPMRRVISEADQEMLDRIKNGTSTEADFARLETIDRTLGRWKVAINTILLKRPQERSGFRARRLRELIAANSKKFVEEYLQKALINQFDHIKHIATGGMGMVIKARNIGLNRMVALKFNLAIDDEERVKAFEREVQLAASIDHPNVVTVYGTGEVKIEYEGESITMVFLELELVEGAIDGKALLKKIHEEKTPFPTDSALFLTRSACAGLREIHGKGLVHQDVKPENFMVMREVIEAVDAWKKSKDNQKLLADLKKTPGLRIIDFGLADEARSDSPSDEAKALKGTPYFMAPEAFDESCKIEPPRDTYAMGLVIYMLLMGSDHPLGPSKGVNKKTSGSLELAHCCAKIAATTDQTPAIAPSALDPAVDRFLTEDPTIRAQNEPIISKLRAMTAWKAADRPSLDEVLVFLDQQIHQRSEEQQTIRKLEKGGRIAMLAGGVLIFAFLALAASVPTLMKNSRRDRFFHSTAAAREQADTLMAKNKWSEAVEVCKNLLREILNNSDLSKNEKEATEESVRSRMVFAEGVLTILLDHLKAEPPRFAEARKLLETLQAMAPEGHSLTDHLVLHIDQSEGQATFHQGMLAFWIGKFDEARGCFKRVKALEGAGLSDEDRKELAIVLGKLEDVEHTLERLGKEALASLHLERQTDSRLKRNEAMTPEYWKLLQDQLLDPDDGSINRILFIVQLLSEWVEQSGDAVDQARLGVLIDELFEHAHSIDNTIRREPGALLRLERENHRIRTQQQRKISTLMGTKTHEGVIKAVVRFVEATAILLRIGKTLSKNDGDKMLQETAELYQTIVNTLPRRERRKLEDALHHSGLAKDLFLWLEKKSHEHE